MHSWHRSGEGNKISIWYCSLHFIASISRDSQRCFDHGARSEPDPLLHRPIPCARPARKTDVCCEQQTEQQVHCKTQLRTRTQPGRTCCPLAEDYDYLLRHTSTVRRDAMKKMQRAHACRRASPQKNALDAHSQPRPTELHMCSQGKRPEACFAMRTAE